MSFAADSIYSVAHHLPRTSEIVLHQSALTDRRLDLGRSSNEVLTKLGLAAAGVASTVTALSLLTSYYGMRVANIIPDTTLRLFDT